MGVIIDSFSTNLLISFLLFVVFQNSDDQPLPLLEHDKLDALLNGIDWDQPLAPLDLNFPTDPDITTLFFFLYYRSSCFAESATKPVSR